MKLSLILGLLPLARTAMAGMDGITDPWSKPYCAFACRAVISSANLTCTIPAGHGMDDGGGHSHGPAMGVVTTASCRASDTNFLTTLAYCIKSRCNATQREIENYWFAQVAGDSKTPPKWTYNTTLENIVGIPNITWASGRTINTTMIVPQSNYNIQVNWIEIMEQNSHYLYKYTSVGVPPGGFACIPELTFVLAS